MAIKSRRRGKGESVSIDLSGVETLKTIPEGTYEVVLNSAEHKDSKKGSPMISFEFEISRGDYKGAKLFENCSLQPQALFKLKAVLEALGFDIPNKAFDLSLKDLIGLTCEVEVGHEVYEGKKRARILQYISPEDGEDEDDEEEEENLEDILSEMDLEELQDLAKGLDISSSDIKKAKKVSKLVNLIMDSADEDDIREALGDEEDDEDDEDDEEEEEENYSEMSLSELKAECKDRGLKIKRGMDKDDLIEMLEEDDED